MSHRNREGHCLIDVDGNGCLGISSCLCYCERCLKADDAAGIGRISLYDIVRTSQTEEGADDFFAFMVKESLA